MSRGVFNCHTCCHQDTSVRQPSLLPHWVACCCFCSQLSGWLAASCHGGPCSDKGHLLREAFPHPVSQMKVTQLPFVMRLD